MDTTSYDVSEDHRFADLDRRITEEMERLRIPGVAVGVHVDGQEYLAGYGVTSIDNPLPVTADTLFQIGSTTKTITATAAMRLVEAGKLQLDAPVRTYLPELRLSDESVAARVTMWHLFTHTGGWVGDYFNDFGGGDDALAGIVASLESLPQLMPLGETFSYSNSGFYIAGRVIEAITGRTFESAIAELVFDPLGMNMSFFFPRRHHDLPLRGRTQPRDGKSWSHGPGPSHEQLIPLGESPPLWWTSSAMRAFIWTVGVPLGA